MLRSSKPSPLDRSPAHDVTCAICANAATPTKARESFPSPRRPVVAWKTPESAPRVPEILKLQNANQVLTQSQDRHPRFAVSSSTPVMHPTRHERVTYSSVVRSSFHEKLRYFSGLFSKIKTAPKSRGVQ